MAGTGKCEMLKIIPFFWLMVVCAGLRDADGRPGPANELPRPVQDASAEIVDPHENVLHRLERYKVGRNRWFLDDCYLMTPDGNRTGIVKGYADEWPKAEGSDVAPRKLHVEFKANGDPHQPPMEATITCPSSRGSSGPIVRKQRETESNDFQPSSLNEVAVDKSGFKSSPDSATTDDVKAAAMDVLRIDGYRIELADKHVDRDDDGVPSVHSYSSVTLRLFGTGITKDTVIIFTHDPHRYGGPCQVPVTEKFRVTHAEPTGKSGLVEIELPDIMKNKKYFYFCAKYEDTDPLSASGENELEAAKVTPFLHQGAEHWMRLISYKPFLPLWLSIVIICVCLVFSALFSGLNLGLMSLDRTDLKILCNTGTDQEKKYARAIQPVRDHGNYLLCSILLGNVLVNSTFTILLDSLTSGLIAIIFSTIAIVIFGEITPQAICSRHGLAVGAKTIMVTKAVMLITFPLSYPTSKILDFLLGKEIGNFYNRERLKELVKVTNDINDLDKDEVNVISGVLELRKKTVSDVMTRLEDAYMLSLNTVLDFETITDIMKSGFSRIPVYDRDNREDIISILHIKDLAFVDPDDNIPMQQLCEFFRNQLHFVFYDQTLDVMFKEFKSGKIGHMAFVQRVNAEGDGDPFYETLGLITLEDVIEELIQAEIIDETDVYTDNRRKVRRERIKRQDFTSFVHRPTNSNVQRLRIASQLLFATYQYISTAVEPFRSNCISETILRRLLGQNIFHQVKIKSKNREDRESIIERGKAIDCFVLILEGRVEVTVGKENLLFESGPFTYFGLQSLVQTTSCEASVNTAEQIMGSLQSLDRDASIRHSFIPDYTVTPVTDVLYMKISRNLYLAAKRATLMERSQKLGDQSMDPIDAEVEKLMHSLDDGDRNSTTPDASNQTVHSGTKTTNAPSPTTALNDLTNHTNSSVTRNHTVLAHNNPSSAGAANEINIGASTSGVGNPDSDPSTAPLLPKP